jgi:hypothetical protein
VAQLAFTQAMLRSVHRFVPCCRSLVASRRLYATEINIEGWSEERVMEIVKKYYPKRQPQTKGWGEEGHVLTGVNILKEGQDPVVKKKGEYPEWVFAIPKDLNLEELIEKEAKLKAEGNSLTPYEARRLKRLRRKNLIKENNYDREAGIQLQ